jgi:hypothetical protein
MNRSRYLSSRLQEDLDGGETNSTFTVTEMLGPDDEHEGFTIALSQCVEDHNCVTFELMIDVERESALVAALRAMHVIEPVDWEGAVRLMNDTFITTAEASRVYGVDGSILRSWVQRGTVRQVAVEGKARKGNVMWCREDVARQASTLQDKRELRARMAAD